MFVILFVINTMFEMIRARLIGTILPILQGTFNLVEQNQEVTIHMRALLTAVATKAIRGSGIGLKAGA